MTAKEKHHLKVQEVLNSPQFSRLVKSRARQSTIMTLIMLGAYFGFILLVGFNKPFLATRMGSVVSYGIPIGIGLILLAWVLTGIYVNWANNSYDKQVSDCKKQLHHE